MESKKKKWENKFHPIKSFKIYPLRKQIKVASIFPNELVNLQDIKATNLLFSFSLLLPQWEDEELDKNCTYLLNGKNAYIKKMKHIEINRNK